MESTHELDHKVEIKRKEELIYNIHAYNIDPVSNHIYLFGEESHVVGSMSECSPEPPCEPGVEFVMANRFIRNLNILMRSNPDKPIIVHMKTNGGDWTEGMAIYNAIKACPNPITIINYTHARSMSSLIFLAANKRVMMPDSYFMFHTGTMFEGGTSKQVYSSVEFNKKLDERMLDIYTEVLKKSGKFRNKSKKSIKELLIQQMDKKEDVYLSTKETVEWGFADEIFGEDGTYNWKKLTEYTNDQLER